MQTSLYSESVSVKKIIPLADKRAADQLNNLNKFIRKICFVILLSDKVKSITV